MKFLDKLYKKRDAAKAEYDKWQGVVDTFESDPDFARGRHNGAVRVMRQAKAKADVVAWRRWTPARRAKFKKTMAAKRKAAEKSEG